MIEFTLNYSLRNLCNLANSCNFHVRLPRTSYGLPGLLGPLQGLLGPKFPRRILVKILVKILENSRNSPEILGVLAGLDRAVCHLPSEAVPGRALRAERHSGCADQLASDRLPACSAGLAWLAWLSWLTSSWLGLGWLTSFYGLGLDFGLISV